MTNGIFEPAEQIEDMLQRLEAARKALETDKQYRMARPEQTGPLLSEAGLYIKQAAGILQRDPELRGDSSIAFKASMKVNGRNRPILLKNSFVR